MQGTDRRGTITEERKGYTAGPPLGKAERGSGGHGDAASDDGTRSKHSCLDAAEVHGAAPPARETLSQAEYLRQGLQDCQGDRRRRPGRSTWLEIAHGSHGIGHHLSKHVMMRAMGGGDLVPGFKCSNRSDGNGLLSDAGVHWTMDK